MSESFAMVPREYYFAFGSNMCLEQMASRCPDSVLKAIGTLAGYRWQINQRGVANVVRSSPSDVVMGIVFQVSERDVKSLDRNEGVSKGIYGKELLEIELQPLSLDELAGRPTNTAGEMLSGYEESLCRVETPNLRLDETRNNSSQHERILNHTSSEQSALVTSPQTVWALVYISDQYCKDGSIRAEYVTRMALAMSDARTLGISDSYLERRLQTIVSSKPQDPVQPKKISKTKTNANLKHSPSKSGEGGKDHSRLRKHGRSGDREERRRGGYEEEGSGNRDGRSQEETQGDVSQDGWFQWIGRWL